MRVESINLSSVANFMANYFEQTQQAVSNLNLHDLSRVVQVLMDANERGATIYICGNGGSASTASHFANDLAKGCSVEGQKRFKAIALTDNVALITAWANDTSYENIFAEQLRGLVSSGDVVIAISGSGNSPNVLRAIEIGRGAGAHTIGFCGYGGGKLRQLAELSVHSDCTVMEQVEDIHMTLCHNVATTLRTLLHARSTPVELIKPTQPNFHEIEIEEAVA